MKIRLQLLIALYAATQAATLNAATGDINSPDARGFLVRGRNMAGSGNERACIDQLRLTGDYEALDPAGRENAEWLRAEATYLSTGGSIAAEELIRSFLGEYPASPRRNDAAMRVADCIFARGNYAEALNAYTGIAPEALNADRREQLAYNRAYCLLQLGRHDEASKAFAGIAEGRTYGNAARFYAGYTAYLNGNYDEARRYFSRVNTSTAPGNTAEYYLAQIYFAEKNYSKALAAARTLLRRNRNADTAFTAEARRIAGESLHHLGDNESAADYLSQYLASTDKPERSALYIMGLYKYSLGNYSEAVGLLAPVSAHRPTDAAAQSAYLYIGQALYRSGDRDAAMTAFDKAMNATADPDVAEAAGYNYIAASLEGAAKTPFSSMTETLDNFLKRYPDGPYSDSVRRYLADGYLADRDYAKALDVLDRISSSGPAVKAARKQALYSLAWQKITAGDCAAALPLLERADKLPGADKRLDAEIRFLRGEALLGCGEHAKAAAALDEYLHDSRADGANRFNALYDLGYARMGMKKYDSAAKAFTQARQQAPGGTAPDIRADILNRLADIAYYDSRFADAERLYAEAAETAPQVADYPVYRCALMKGYLRRHAEKVDDLQNFRNRFPASPLMPEALLELTASYIQLGRDDDALTVYRLLAERHADTGQGRQAALQMGLTLTNNGRRDQAIEAYRHVIDRYPGSDEADMAAALLANLGISHAGTPADQDSGKTPAIPVPDSDSELEAKAIAAYNAGESAEARDTWRHLEARASDPAAITRARMGIMRAARDMADYPTMLEASEAILSSSAAGSATFCEATFSRALALSETGRTEEARSLWSTVAGVTADEYGAKSAYYLAESLAESGQTDRAMRTASELVSSGTPHAYWLARAFILISDLYAAQGKNFEAREYLDALKQNYPGNDSDIFMMIEQRLDKFKEK